VKGFKEYNPENPLVYIHVYKTAGCTMRRCFKKWYSRDGVAKHQLCYHDDYYKSNKSFLTCNSTQLSLYKAAKVVPIFIGHFNNVNYSFPEECNQFITTLRNPLDRAISAYFYNLKETKNKFTDICKLEEFLRKPDYTGITKVFTKELFTLENYKNLIQKYFVYIGTTEHFSWSLSKIVWVLNKKLTPEMLSIWENKTEYNVSVTDELKEYHREKHKLEYAIYDYVVELNNF